MEKKDIKNCRRLLCKYCKKKTIIKKKKKVLLYHKTPKNVKKKPLTTKLLYNRQIIVKQVKGNYLLWEGWRFV